MTNKKGAREGQTKKAIAAERISGDDSLLRLFIQRD